MKRICSLLLCLLLLVSVYPAAALAGEEKESAREAPLIEEGMRGETEESAQEENDADQSSGEDREKKTDEENEDPDPEEGQDDPIEKKKQDEDKKEEEKKASEDGEEEPASEDGESTEKESGEEKQPEEEAEQDEEEAVVESEDEDPEDDVPGVLIEEAEERVAKAKGGSDEDDLLALYIEQQFRAQLPSRGRRAQKSTGSRLTGSNAVIYAFLKGQITKVAAGEIASTVFVLPIEDLALEQTSWNAEELGVEEIYTDTEQGRVIKKEATNAVWKKIDVDMNLVIRALLADCPYELYWYDKTAGVSYKLLNPSISNTDDPRLSYGNIRFSFPVSEDYSAGEYQVDTSTGERVQTAVSRAKSIVEQYRSSSDLEKLLGYKREIRALSGYNSGAAGGEYDGYGDPWQLVWVFDGDPTTTVVCEGFAKAFQYLCDLTTFSSPITCRTVTGNMGSEKHMWNIVTMDDGKNYLADVTNSVGNERFLNGYDRKNDENSYTFDVSEYVYDDSTLSLYKPEELELSPTSYFETLESYRVTYDANGGKGAPKAQVKTWGIPLTLSEDTPARKGFVFLGWSADQATATADYQPGDSYEEEADLTLYAVWEKIQPEIWVRIDGDETVLDYYKGPDGIGQNKDYRFRVSPELKKDLSGAVSVECGGKRSRVPAEDILYDEKSGLLQVSRDSGVFEKLPAGEGSFLFLFSDGSTREIPLRVWANVSAETTEYLRGSGDEVTMMPTDAPEKIVLDGKRTLKQGRDYEVGRDGAVRFSEELLDGLEAGTHSFSFRFSMGKETYSIDRELEIRAEYHVTKINGQDPTESGKKAEWFIGSGKSITIQTDGSKAFFDSFLVDGRIVPEESYYVYTREGSLVVELLPSFLDRLEPGEHQLTVAFLDGEASADFAVRKASSGPKTGDESSAFLWICLMVFSGTAVPVLLRKRFG